MSLLDPRPSPRFVAFLNRLGSLKKIGVAALFIMIGGAIFTWCFSAWQADPERSYIRVVGTVLGHEVHLDEQRWNARETAALVLESRVRIPTFSGGPAAHEILITEFFARADSAWAFATARPAGSSQSCLVAPTADTAKWSSPWPSPTGGGMIFGGVLLLIGLGILVPPFAKFRSQAPLFTFCLAFATAGLLAAIGIWPDTYYHVRAADWPAVPFQKLGERTLRSGGTHRSQSHEIAIRYVYLGQSYDAVLEPASFGVPTVLSGQCRIHPARPSQACLSWGWRPAIAIGVLFPLPFLAAGLGGLLAFLVPPLRRLLARSGSREPDHPWGQVLMNGFTLCFVGSIVGIFVAFCIEIWIAGQALASLFTLFLLPFVFVTLRLAFGFAKSVKVAWQGPPALPSPLVSVTTKRSKKS